MVNFDGFPFETENRTEMAIITACVQLCPEGLANVGKQGESISGVSFGREEIKLSSFMI